MLIDALAFTYIENRVQGDFLERLHPTITSWLKETIATCYKEEVISSVEEEDTQKPLLGCIFPETLYILYSSLLVLKLAILDNTGR